jgi:F0F1-type ATP synthase assembly protein I
MPNNEDQKKMLESLMGQLNAEDRRKLESVLADKSATEKILSTPQAQQLLQKLKGGK